MSTVRKSPIGGLIERITSNSLQDANKSRQSRTEEAGIRDRHSVGVRADNTSKATKIRRHKKPLETADSRTASQTDRARAVIARECTCRMCTDAAYPCSPTDSTSSQRARRLGRYEDDPYIYTPPPPSPSTGGSVIRAEKMESTPVIPTREVVRERHRSDDRYSGRVPTGAGLGNSESELDSDVDDPHSVPPLHERLIPVREKERDSDDRYYERSHRRSQPKWKERGVDYRAYYDARNASEEESDLDVPYRGRPLSPERIIRVRKRESRSRSRSPARNIPRILRRQSSLELDTRRRGDHTQLDGEICRWFPSASPRSQTTNDGGNNAIRLPVSRLREDSSHCSSCRLLQRALERSEKEIGRPSAIQDVEIIPASDIQPYSRCRFSLGQNDSSYELIFGYSGQDATGEVNGTRAFLRRLSQRPFGCVSKSQLKIPASAIKGWIAQCSDSHQHCWRPQSASLPRRVIDVGHKESFLYETRGEVQPYATLSHCWHDSQPLKTLRASLTRHQGRLIWSQLPIAFQEAIEIVRSLGMRYLWIDSLCIVQDDEKEWEIESGRMANIFENSTVTIALHQAGPNQTSFPKSLCTFVEDYCGREIQFHLWSTVKIDNDLERSRLSTRGWCFQERLLATRIVHCLPNGVFLECAHREGCTCTSLEPHIHHCSEFKIMFTQDLMSSENWRKMVSLYTQKNLTYPKDILPALSGVTNRVRGAGKYYGGLWEQNLSYDLLWFPTVGPSGSKTMLPNRPWEDIAPSFLWASVKGQISFIDIKPNTPDFTQTFQICEITLEPKGEDLLGQLSSGELVLRGPVVDAKFVCSLEKPMVADFLIKDLETNCECFWAVLECPVLKRHYLFHPDSQWEKGDFLEDMLCIQLFENSNPTDERCYALVLGFRNQEPASKRVRRVGIIASIEKHHFKTAPIKQVEEISKPRRLQFLLSKGFARKNGRLSYHNVMLPAHS